MANGKTKYKHLIKTTWKSNKGRKCLMPYES